MCVCVCACACACACEYKHSAGDVNIQGSQKAAGLELEIIQLEETFITMFLCNPQLDRNA